MNQIPLHPSPPGWIPAALERLDQVLLDHAHCEKKAAATALRIMTRHTDWPGLAGRMSRLAREELVHFERVLEELRRRGVRFVNQPSARYAAALFEAARPGSVVDEMICCALIEARSHERFVLLEQAVGDERLAKLYGDLLEAEARHGDMYLELATEAAATDAAADDAAAVVAARLAELAAHEAQVIARAGQPVRMHAGGVA
jgi:tRNA-(ms[2]io[6]A)-hydroxylase